MTTTPDNYLRAADALRQMQEEASGHMTRLDDGLRLVAQAAAGLRAMPARWGDAVAYINAQSGGVWDPLKAELAQTVTDFQAMETRAAAVNTAATTARAG